jgi:hypothetical protein
VPGRDYQVGNGWTAFTEYDSSMSGLQAWLRSPTATTTQVTSVNLGCVSLDGLGSNGDVMVRVLAGGTTQRWLIPYAMAPLSVSTTMGTARQFADGWYLIIGASLYRLAPAPDMAVGSDDLGTSDDLGEASDLAVEVGAMDAGAPSDGGTASAAHRGCAMDGRAGATGFAPALLLGLAMVLARARWHRRR